MATVFEPIKPVPPITTIFMVFPFSSSYRRAAGKTLAPLCSVSTEYAHVATSRQKCYCPPRHHEESVRESDQVVNMNSRPDEPRHEPCRLPKAKVCYGEPTSHDRKIAFVQI